MINGHWTEHTPVEQAAGRFVRSDAQFRNWITPAGEPGPTGRGGFAAEPGRYHLYVSLACLPVGASDSDLPKPQASRRQHLAVGRPLVSVVHWFMGSDGWTFADGPGVRPDPICGAHALHEVYASAQPGYSGRATVPVLFDKRTRTIVSNESSEIIRMMNSAFDRVGAAAGDYYPPDLRVDLDDLNAEIYDRVNNGVYKAGFATTQEAYEEAVWPLVATLDRLEECLSTQRYLCGDRVTEADWRLFTTLLRFDAVYVGHFKCNLRRIVDYPNLWGYTRELCQWPGVRETVDFDHIKRHYHQSHETINPSRIVPIGPELDFDRAHGRERLRAAV